MRYRKGQGAREGASEGASKAQSSRVDEKSSEVKAEAKEESVIEPVEKSEDTSLLTPSKKKIRKTSRAKAQKLNVVWIKLSVV